jgi:hypothetical protein
MDLYDSRGASPMLIAEQIDIDLIATRDELKKLLKNVNDFAELLKIF